MGRIKFSLLSSLFFTLGVTILGSVLDILLNKIFENTLRIDVIFTYKNLFHSIFMFVVWFVTAYYYLWNEIVNNYKNNLKDEN